MKTGYLYKEINFYWEIPREQLSATHFSLGGKWDF